MQTLHHPSAPSRRIIRAALALFCLCPLSSLPAEEFDALEQAMAEGKWPVAKAMAQALTRGEEAAEGWKYLALIALQEDDSKAATGFADKATKDAPDRADLHLVRARAYGVRVNDVGMLRKMGVAKQIRQSYEAALELEPENAEAMLGLYEYYRQAPAIAGGGNDKALAMLKRLEVVRPALARLHLALGAMQDKRFGDARIALREGLQADPENPALRYQLGRLASFTGENLDEGKEALKSYLKIPEEANRPSHAAALWRLGQIHVHLGDPESARDCFERSIQLDPEMEGFVRPELEQLAKTAQP